LLGNLDKPEQPTVSVQNPEPSKIYRAGGTITFHCILPDGGKPSDNINTSLILLGGKQQ